MLPWRGTARWLRGLMSQKVRRALRHAAVSRRAALPKSRILAPDFPPTGMFPPPTSARDIAPAKGTYSNRGHRRRPIFDV